jgi:excisionase family DNA binding protein
MEQQDVTMTADQAAEYLNIHPDTMRRLLRQGVLPGRHVGRQWRIRKVELDKYLSQRDT